MRSTNLLAGLALLGALAASPGAAATASGAQIYADNCAACHQPGGEGRPPAFPSLKGGKIALGPKPALLALVLNGKGAMPPWKDELDDAQIAAVTSYLRSSFGNKAPPVTVKDVAAARKAR